MPPPSRGNPRRTGLGGGSGGGGGGLTTYSAVDIKGTFVNIDYANGSDAFDGQSPLKPKKTFQAGINFALSNSFRCDIYLSNNANHVVTDQINIPAGTSVHGARGNPFAAGPSSDFNGSTIVEWNGPNTAGKAVISTQFPALPEAGYAAGGIIEGFQIYIPTTTQGAVATTNIVGMDCRNWQNGSILRDVTILGGVKAGFYFYRQGATSPAGFFKVERCWVYGGGDRPFLVDGLLENILFDNCGVDNVNHHALAAWTVSGVSSPASQGSLTLLSCKNEMWVGTSGGAGDYPFIDVLVGADPQIIALGCYEQSGISSGSLTTPCIRYSGTPSMPDDAFGTIPVHVVGMMSQSRQLLLTAPNATPAISVAPTNAPASGHYTRWSWDNSNRAVSQIPRRGLFAARGLAAQFPGQSYFATDDPVPSTGTMYQSDGTNWNQVSTVKGEIARAEVSTAGPNTSGTTVPTDLTGASITFTLATDRVVTLEGNLSMQNSAADALATYIRDGSSTIVAGVNLLAAQMGAALPVRVPPIRRSLNLVAGTYTYKLSYLAPVSGTGASFANTTNHLSVIRAVVE